MGRRSEGFTFLEMLIVLVIVGVLATLGISYLFAPKEQALLKEATSNLKLIAAAERIYRLESNAYINSTTTKDTNDILRLLLPTSASRQWDYTVSSDGSTFTVKATKVRGPNSGKSWCLDSANVENQTPEECP